MSVEIKSLTIGVPVVDNSLPAQGDYFNVLELANTVYTLYTAPEADSSSAKSAIIKNMRFVNMHLTDTVKLDVYFTRLNADGQYRRRQISPVGMALPAGFVYIEDEEVTLEPGDMIQAKADKAGVVQFLIAGVEREVV